MQDLLSLALVFLASFSATLLALPFLIPRLERRGLVGVDLNKFGKPSVAELGGISVLLGFSFSFMVALFLFNYLQLFEADLTLLLAAFATILLIGFLGIVDDLIGWKKGIRQWQHALFPIMAALPLMALKVGVDYMDFPIIGRVFLGVGYSLLIVPIGITGASNAANMIAGMNGLEAGMGIIMSVTMLVIAITLGRIEAAILMVALMGALLAFLRFNWFPARIFPGDSLTLMVGASIATAAIIGNMERFGVLVMAIYFCELLFKAKHKFQSECYGIPQRDGTLKAAPRGGSITQWIMRRGRFTEKQVVGIVLAAQIAVSLAVLLDFFVLHYNILAG